MKMGINHVIYLDYIPFIIINHTKIYI